MDRLYRFLFFLGAAVTLAAQDDAFIRSYDNLHNTYDYLMEESYFAPWREEMGLLSGSPVPQEMSPWLDMMEDDLIEWSVSMLEQSIEESDLKSLTESLETQNSLWLYRHQGDSIEFDTAGDPVVRSSNPVEIARDKSRWMEEVDKTREQVLSRWDLNAGSVLSGIVNRLPTEFRESAEERLQISLGQYRNRVRQEADRFILWSSANFDSVREDDMYSLRKKSEEETATALSQRLVDETRLSLIDTDKSLNEGIQELQEAFVQEASFSLENWDESFQREFQIGLDHWADAENSLIEQRLNWELRSEEKYLEAEKSWERAFETFFESRKSWIQDIYSQIEEGRKTWDAKEESFSSQFDSIAYEIEKAAAEQENKFSRQVQSAIELYRESLALLASSGESIKYYEGKVHEITPGYNELLDKQTELSQKSVSTNATLFDLNIELKMTEDLLASSIENSFESMRLQSSITSLKKEIRKLEFSQSFLNIQLAVVNKQVSLKAGEIGLFKSEIAAWTKLQNSLISQLTDSKNMLISLESEANGYDQTVPVGTLENEIDRIKGVSESLYSQWLISEAVVEYAEMNSSARPTEAQTALAYEEADQALIRSEQEYQSAITSLSALRTKLAEGQITLSESRILMEEARVQMISSQQEYDTAFSIYQSNNPAVIEQMIKDLETELEIWFEGDESQSPMRNDLYSSIIKTSEYEARLANEEERKRIIRDYMGEEEDGESDLYADIPELVSRLASIKSLAPDFENQNSEDWEIQLFEGGFTSETEDFMRLTSLYNACFTEPGAVQAKLELMLLLKNISDSVEIKLLTNQKSIEWLEKTSLKDGESVASIESGLNELYSLAENNLLYNRAVLLSEIFSGMESGEYSDKSWKEYADYLMLQDMSEISLEGLSSLVDILSHLNSDVLDREQAYSSMDESSRNWFLALSGKRSILPGQYYLDLYLADVINDYQDAVTSLTSWEKTKAFQHLTEDDFKKTNILLDSSSGNEFYEKLENFNSIEEIVQWYVPLYTNESVPDYFKSTVNRYIALNYGQALSEVDTDSAAIAAELIQLEGRIDQLGITESEIQNSLKSIDSFEIFDEAGFTQELREWCDYNILLEWNIYFRDAQDQAWADALALAEENETEVAEPVIDKESIFKSFLADTSRSDIELSVLEELDLSGNDYSDTADYSEWMGLSADEFIAEHYPDAGYIEYQFLKIMIEGSDRSLGNLWYHISSDFFQKMLEEQKNTSNEYNRIQILQALKSTESFDEDITRDIQFIKAMVVECGQSMLSDTIPVPLDSSQSLWQSFQNHQLIGRNNSEKIVKLRTDLDISRRDSEKYKTEVVDALFDDYDTREKEFNGYFKTYQEQITLFENIQQEYLDGQGKLNEAYETYKQASAACQQAGEILNFAQTGYSPETANVYSIRDERQKMYEKAIASLQVLEDIRDSGKNQAVVDEQWQDYVNESQQLLSLNNNLGYAREELTKELGSLNREYNLTLGNLAKEAQDLVSFPEGFHFEPGMLNGTLSDLSLWGNNSLGTQFAEYKKDSKKYTQDVILWMRDMYNQSSDSSLLETFSYAYYNELRAMGKSWDQIKSEYNVNLFGLSYHDSLLDSDGNFFQSVHIGYEGDLNKYKAGGYEKVEKVFYSFGESPEVTKVYISPEEWLKERTEQYKNEVCSNSQMKRLYSFYKVLMFNDQFKGLNLKTGMSKDLSVMAWNYLEPVAEKQKNKFKRKIFSGYRDPGGDLRDWINSIDDSMTSGIIQRDKVFENIKSGKADFLSLSSNVQRRNTLTASDGLNIASLQSVIKTVTGITLGTEQKQLLTQSFNSLSDMEKSSCVVALQGLQKSLAIQKQVADHKTLQRESELKHDQQIMYTQLLAEYNRDDFDIDSYRTLAGHLYENPTYLEEDYSALRFGSIWASDKPSEQDSLYTMTAYGQQLVRSFKSRMSLVKQDRYTEMQNELEGIYNQRQFWEDRIGELTNEGMEQWNLSTQRLIGQRDRWRDDFERDYQYKTVLWEGKYKLLVRNKNSWIRNSSEAAISSGTYAMARDMNLDARSLIGEVNFSLVPDISVETGDMDRIVNDSLGGTTMYKLLAGVKSMTARAGAHDAVLSARLPSVPDTTRAMDSLQEKQLVLKEDISKALALAQAYQMKDTVEKTRESILDNIDDANEGVDQSVESQLASAGYARNGSMFSRDVVIDSSLLGGNENELHEIEEYKYFDAPSFDVGVNLDVNFMKNLDSSMIQAGVKLAQERLYNYMNLIFGSEKDKDDKPIDIRTGLDESFIQYLERQEAAFKSSAQYNTAYDSKDDDGNTIENTEGKHTSIKGLFYFHVGYAPEMDEDDPEDVKVDGYGEMGRIYEKFMRQQARLMRGLSTMSMPWYSQKIWDDDADNDGDSDGFIGAPSVRSVTDIALTVAGTAMGMGPFPAMMLSMVDDAIFTVADIGNGFMDADDAALGFAKKAGVSMLSYGAGQLTAGLDKLASFEGYGSQFLEVSTDIANTGLSTTINNYGSAAINSITTDGFNLDGFNSMTSWDAMQMGYISGMAGTAVSSSLELGTFGFIGDAFMDSAKFTSMMGGLASTGLEYAMTGEAKLNVMNLGGTGVMELNLGGNGNLFNLGMGGTDVSLGAIRSAGRGLQAYSKNIEIKRSVEDKRLWAGMRTLYSTAEGSETKSLYNDVIAGNAEFMIGTGQSFDGRTTAESGKRIIELNTEGKSRLDLAVLMSHEAYRDGYDNGAQGQTDETYKAAVGHMQVSSALQSIYGSRTLSDANNSEAELFNKVVAGKISGNALAGYIGDAYDSAADYWKLMDNGDLVKDNDGWLKDQNGNYKLDKDGKRIGAEGIETGLLNILNGGTSNKAYSEYSDAEIQAAQQLMINAGFTPSEVENFKDRMWYSGNDGKTIKANSTLAGFGDSVATSVFMNGYDQVTDNILFGNNDAVTLNTIMGLPETSRDRFIYYLSAKENFWDGSHNIAEDLSELGLSTGGGYRKASGYPDNQHRTVDIKGPEGTPLLAMFGGKVVDEKFNTSTSGYSTVVEYGFNFENDFYSTGIQSQQMHFKEESPLSVGDYVNSSSVVGLMGNTGKSDGVHVHPQFMSNMTNGNPYDKSWDMLNRRRNVFLDFINAPASNFWEEEGTNTQNSYSNYYKRFFYNPTNFYNGMFE